jgi:hypothetical protein
VKHHVEERVRAAMSATGNLAEREISSAPPLRLPSRPAPETRRVRAPRRWGRWAAPVTAAAAVVVLAVSLVVVKGPDGGDAVPAKPEPSASPAAPTGPGGAPRYYTAQSDGAVVVGDTVTGKLLATFTPPKPTSLTTLYGNLTAAADDQTFVFSAVSEPTASFKAVNGPLKVTATMRWYEIRLSPGSAHPARLAPLPLKPLSMTGTTAAAFSANALSGSGQELAMTGLTGSGGLAVKVYSVATGRLLRQWTTSDPSLTWNSTSSSQGLSPRPSLTWVNGDRALDVQAGSRTPQVKDLGFGSKDVIRELSVTGPSSGDLVADGKVVWDVQRWEYPQTLLQACDGDGLQSGSLTGENRSPVSTGGTTFGCAAVTGPGNDPDLSFVTYPLGAGASTAKKATVHYQVLHMAKVPVSSQEFLWVSPSGDAVIGAWATQQKGTVTDDPNGLHVGVMSHGKFTPLKFPAGFVRAASVASVTF